MTNVIDLKTKKPNPNAKAKQTSSFDEQNFAKCEKIISYMNCLHHELLKDHSIDDVELFKYGIERELDELLVLRRKNAGWSSWRCFWAVETKRKTAPILIKLPFHTCAAIGSSVIISWALKAFGF